MKGWRTILFGFAVAVVPAGLEYLAGIDWTSLGISPAVAAGIGAAIIGLRALTTTAIGRSS